jgi:RecA-family ATPase
MSASTAISNSESEPNDNVVQKADEVKGDWLDSWAPPLLDDYLEAVDDVPEWLLIDMLPADSNILVSGKAKRAYKSWLAFLTALAVASGKEIPPLIPANKAGLPVLVLEAEGGRAQTKNRWKWLKKSYGFENARLPIYFVHREASLYLDDIRWVERVRRFIVAKGIKLVIADPLAMFSKGDENNVRDAVKLMNAFVQFREQGASCMFLHHLRKTDKDWEADIDEEIRGSSAFAGFYDTHFALRNRGATLDYNELTIRSKDDAEKKYEVRWFIDKVAGTAQARFDRADDDSANQRILDEMAVQLIMGEVYTRKRLEEMLCISGAKLDEVLKVMIDEGRVERVGHSRFKLKTLSTEATPQ